MRAMPCQVGDQRFQLVAVDVTAGEQQALPLAFGECAQAAMIAVSASGQKRTWTRANAAGIASGRCDPRQLGHFTRFQETPVSSGTAY